MLVGCVANSSNPRVSLQAVAVTDAAADLALRIENPGGRDLTVSRVDYELSHGEMALPVANGAWDGALDLPAGGAAQLELHVPFDVPPIEADSTVVHLNGTLHLTDHTGFLGWAAMDLTQSPFQLDGGGAAGEGDS